jgi:tetratricopeptide (TPR) repeat protein
MFSNEDHNDFKDIEFLKEEFDKMKRGSAHKALHEDDFEALIDHFEIFGDTENWKLACEMSTEIFPFSIGLMMRKAEWFLAQKKPMMALAIVEKLKNKTIGDLDSLLLHAEILLECDKANEAIILLEDEFEKYNDTDQVFILMELAEVYDEQTEFEKVYATLKRALTINPQYDDALVRMCFWADVTKQQADCIQFHQKIIDDYPLYAAGWYNLGLLFQSIKDFKQAIESYENCLAIDTSYEYALRNLGECYIQTEDFDKAISILEEHIETAKTEDVILETLAFCWEHKKQYAKARYYYRKSSSLNPEDDSIFYKIGLTYTKERSWQKAIKSFSVAVHLDNTNDAYCLALGNCLLETEASEEALVCFLKAVELAPNQFANWEALIYALYKADYLNEALVQIEEGIKACGNRIEFEYFKSGIYLALGKTKDAILFFENALIIDIAMANCLNALDKEILLHPLFAEIYIQYKKESQ